MQPYEVAEILGSDIDNGLTKAGVAHARRKYGSNIIKEELSLSFGQSLKKQLLGIHGLLVLLCAVILYIFTPDPLYMLLAVCAAAVTLVNAYLESRSQKAIKSTLRRVSPKAIVIRDGREFSVGQPRARSRRRHPAGGRPHRPRGRTADRSQQPDRARNAGHACQSLRRQGRFLYRRRNRRRHRAEYGLRSLSRHRRQREGHCHRNRQGHSRPPAFGRSARATRCRRC